MEIRLHTPLAGPLTRLVRDEDGAVKDPESMNSLSDLSSSRPRRVRLHTNTSIPDLLFQRNANLENDSNKNEDVARWVVPGSAAANGSTEKH